MAARTPTNKTSSVDVVVFDEQAPEKKRHVKNARCVKRLDFSEFVVVRKKKNNEEDNHTQIEQENHQKVPPPASIQTTKE